MAKEVLELEVKSNIGNVTKDTDKMADSLEDVNKEAKEGIGNFTLMGVSLNGIKTAMGKVIPMAKTMFGTIKAGMISTGVGALVVAFGSLVAWFTRTKEGAEVLSKSFKMIGTAVSVVLDRIGGLGNAIALLFQGKFAESAAAAKAAISGIGIEILLETAAMKLLTEASQKLADAQRKLNVETAQSVAQIEKLKLLAEDITKSYAKREEAANSAFTKEAELENKRITLAKEAVRIETERHALMGKDGVMAADLDALAELEINLANIRQESAGRQISLQNFLNGLRQTELAEKEALRLKEKEDDDAAFDAKIKANDEWNKSQIAGAQAVADATKLIDDKLASTKKATLEMGAAAAIKIAGEGSALGKSVAVAMAVMNTKEAVTAALGMKPYGPWNIAQAIATGVFGMTQVQGILSTPIPGGGGGGGGGGGVSSAIPAPQMMSGAFDISGGVAPDPVQAFVVTDEMTNSQNQLANIRRRATI